MADRAVEMLHKAEQHYRRVQEASHEPTDWSDLALYGFYCLEAAVMAAATYYGMKGTRSHLQKVKIAAVLHARHQLPDVSLLLPELNRARKAVAYGNVAMPKLDAKGLATEIELYVHAVQRIVQT